MTGGICTRTLKKSIKIRTIGKSSTSKNMNILNKTMRFITWTPMRKLTDMKKKWLNMITLKKERHPSNESEDEHQDE